MGLSQGNSQNRFFIWCYYDIYQEKAKENRWNRQKKKSTDTAISRKRTRRNMINKYDNKTKYKTTNNVDLTKKTEGELR